MSQYEFSVSVQTQYLPEQSDPDAHQFAFAYTLTIRNTGQVAAQLISRHWIITDSDDVVQEVKGLAWWGTSHCCRPARNSSTRAGLSLRRPLAPCAARIFASPKTANVSTRPLPSFRCTCRVRCTKSAALMHVRSWRSR